MTRAFYFYRVWYVFHIERKINYFILFFIFFSPMLRIQIRIDPHHFKKLDPDPHQREKVETLEVQFWRIGGSKSGNKLIGRMPFRIHITLQGRIRIRIRIRVKGRFRILFTKPPVSLRISSSLYFASRLYLPYLVTHLSTEPFISLHFNSSLYWAKYLSTFPLISLLSRPYLYIRNLANRLYISSYPDL
jgi:hypothetical protein